MNLGLSGDEDSAEEEVAEDKALERVSSSIQSHEDIKCHRINCFHRRI